ncbi:MAG TPA: hypothetical protein PK640_17765, partial [Verrucomicrobiota bacterium]|nr:hypothetical protein [Verrucomicrobiota bacterium]
WAGPICVSHDGGQTWSSTTPLSGNVAWSAVAMSADGQTIMAAEYSSRLVVSTDGGSSWSAMKPDGEADRRWVAVACSADGQQVFAAYNSVLQDPLATGKLFTSSDGGGTWTERHPAGITSQNWYDVACAADGQTILAGVRQGRLYVSTDFGVTWSETRPRGDANADWETVAVSGDGQRLVAGGGEFLNRLYVGVASEPGLVFHLTCNGGAHDFSGNENRSTVHGAVLTEDRYGSPQSAYYFNGGQYIEVQDSPSLRSPSSQITVAAWVRIDQLDGGVWAPVLCKSTNSSNLAGTRQYCFDPYGAGTAVSAVMLGDGIMCAISNPVPLGRWCHWALTYGEGGLVAYVDGTEVTRGPHTGPLPVNNDPLQIGRDIPGSVEYLIGAIDDLRIYNRALSASEVRLLYQDVVLAPPTFQPGGMIRLECGRVDGQPINPDVLAGYALQISNDLRTWTDAAAQPEWANGQIRFETPIAAGASLQFYRVVRR